MFTDSESNWADRSASMGARKTRSTNPWDRMPETSPTAPPKRAKLDSEEMVDLHSRLLGYYRRELSRQEDHRVEMAIDADFYDGIQLSDAMVAHMTKRGQTPLTFNVISNVVNWLLGTERRTRTDYRILPRREDATQSAERKSQLLKYLSDANRSPFHMSRAFADAVRVGVGWMEDGVHEEGEGEPIFSRYESWRNVLHDSASTELDLSDARYVFRIKWLDPDAAIDLFPKRAEQIKRAAASSTTMHRSLDGYGDEVMDSVEDDIATHAHSGAGDSASPYDRERVRLIECWYRMPSTDLYMVGGQFSGEIYDSKSSGHVQDYLTGNAAIEKRTRMRMHVAIMTEQDMLWQSKSPYRHNRFPLTPIWCYRRDRDNLPYGLVRQMRDPQIDVNHRVSRALHILNSNKVVMDKGAVDDIEAFIEEAARSDAVIVKNPGKSLELDAERGLEQAHLGMMHHSIQLIQAMTGVTDENMGRSTNATSGKAIMARQDQGALATAPIFDRYRLARQVMGEKRLSLIEQFMSEQRQFRITNMRGNPTFITINDGAPENDIVASKADFIISEDEFAASLRQSQVEELMNLLGQIAPVMPQLVGNIADLLVEMTDVPQREEIVKRIRQITGMEDPDADPNNPDPETEARKAQAEKEAQFAEQMAMAELEGKQADAAYKRAQAERMGIEKRKLTADIRRILAQAEGEAVKTQDLAATLAERILALPQMGAVADTVLDSAGFVDRSDIAAAGRAQPKLPSAPMPDPAPQPMAPAPPPQPALM